MSDTGIPSDLEAERALLGSMIVWPQGIGDVIEYVVTEDFYRPLHRDVFDACTSLHLGGQSVDVITVYDECQRKGKLNIEKTDVLSITTGDSGRQWKRYADIIIQHSLRRRLLGEAMELQKAAHDLSIDPIDTLERHQMAINRIDTSIVTTEPDDVAVEDFLNRDREKIAPWVIHGIIRRSHKIMIVGPEGGGKSWLLRYIAICAAYGIQPFRHEKIKPVKTLIVDVENPEDSLFDSFETILKKVTRESSVTNTVNRLWWRPGGINLRNRVDLAELDNVIQSRQPDLVCLGPLYAAYENSSKDFGWETAAREVQQSFRKLRKKYDFALMIEDHAPQSDGSGNRPMRPYGSSFWLRWPELGIGLEPIKGRKDAFDLSRWRGDRIATDWPSRIIRGSAVNSPWPFVGEWD